MDPITISGCLFSKAFTQFADPEVDQKRDRLNRTSSTQAQKATTIAISKNKEINKKK